MRRRDIRDVKAALQARSRTRSIDELAAAGKRHVRVVSRREVVALIQAIVDEALARGSGDMPAQEKKALVARARKEVSEVARRQALADQQLQRQEQKLERYEQQVQQLQQREQELKDELKDARRREQDVSALVALVQQLAEGQGAASGAGPGPRSRPVDATDPLLARLFDDDRSVKSNRRQVRHASRTSSRSISDSLEHLRRLRDEGQEKTPKGGRKSGRPQARPRPKPDKRPRA